MREVEEKPQSTRPPWLDYATVEKYLESVWEPREMKELSDRPIIRRDGQSFYFSKIVCHVTEELQRRGFAARRCKKSRIISVALEVSNKRIKFHPFQGPITVSIVSFKLSAADAQKLETFLKTKPIIGVKSAGQLARKVLMDFMSDRLVYRDPTDLVVDSWGLGLKAAITEEVLKKQNPKEQPVDEAQELPQEVLIKAKDHLGMLWARCSNDGQREALAEVVMFVLMGWKKQLGWT